MKNAILIACWWTISEKWSSWHFMLIGMNIQWITWANSSHYLSWLLYPLRQFSWNVTQRKLKLLLTNSESARFQPSSSLNLAHNHSLNSRMSQLRVLSHKLKNTARFSPVISKLKKLKWDQKSRICSNNQESWCLSRELLKSLNANSQDNSWRSSMD